MSSGNSIGSGLGSKTTSKNSQEPANEKAASSEDEVHRDLKKDDKKLSDLDVLVEKYLNNDALFEEDPNFATDDFNTDLNADELQEEMKALGMDDNVDWEKAYESQSIHLKHTDGYFRGFSQNRPLCRSH